MLGFYVLLEDPDANVIIALALHSALLQLGFFYIFLLLISPGPWLQAKTQQPICVVGLVILFMSMVKTQHLGNFTTSDIYCFHNWENPACITLLGDRGFNFMT